MDFLFNLFALLFVLYTQLYEIVFSRLYKFHRKRNRIVKHVSVVISNLEETFDLEELLVQIHKESRASILSVYSNHCNLQLDARRSSFFQVKSLEEFCVQRNPNPSYNLPVVVNLNYQKEELSYKNQILSYSYDIGANSIPPPDFVMVTSSSGPLISLSGYPPLFLASAEI